MFIATWCAWPISGRNFFGVSRLIIERGPLGGVSGVSGARAAGSSVGCSDEHPTFHEPDGPEVAVPPLDRVLLDEAVSAEQLHAVVADLHAPLGAQPAGQRHLAGERLALGGAGRGPVGDQTHAVQL